MRMPDDILGQKSPDDLRQTFDRLRQAAEQLAEKVPLLSRVIPVAPNQPATVVTSPAGDHQVTGNGLTVREYAKLTKAVYDPKYGDPSTYTAPDGWTLLHATPNSRVGYASCEYTDANGNYVCAFRGTDDLDDVIPDILQGIGLFTAQFDLASELAHDLAWRFQNGWLYCDAGETVKATSLSFTGHSLGGGLAGSAWTLTGYPTVTFNGAGVSLGQRFDDDVLQPLSDGSQALINPGGACTNYHVYREILSTGQWALSSQWMTTILPQLQKLEEQTRMSLAAHAASHQIMLQRPGNPPLANVIELHKMASVLQALELPPYADGKNDPF
jgi:hypothetical protein